MIEAALLAWKAAGTGLRIAAIVGPLLAFGTLYGVWHTKVWHRGYDAAMAEIAADNAAAVSRASKLRDSYESCSTGGGRWDQTAGRCR
jgi:hypothetical protein